MKVLLFCILAGALMACSGSSDEPTAVSGSEKDEATETTTATATTEDETQTAEALPDETKTTQPDTTAAATTTEDETQQPDANIQGKLEGTFTSFATTAETLAEKNAYPDLPLQTAGPVIEVEGPQTAEVPPDETAQSAEQDNADDTTPEEEDTLQRVIRWFQLGNQVCQFKEHYLMHGLVTVGPDIIVPDVEELKTDYMPEVILRNLRPANFDSQWDRWETLFSWWDDFTKVSDSLSVTQRSTDDRLSALTYSYTYDEDNYENWCESGKAPCEVIVEYREQTEEPGKIVANIFFKQSEDDSLLLDFFNCD